MYKHRRLSCKTNNENLSGKGKKASEPVKVAGRAESQEEWGKRSWKARSEISLQRHGRRINVNEMDGPEAERFAQVIYPRSCKGMQDPRHTKLHSWQKRSQSRVTLACVSPSGVRGRRSQ